MSNLQRNLMKSKLPPMAPRSARNMPGRQKDYNPSQWSEFFDNFIDVKTDENCVFRCYRTKAPETTDAPVLALLHGGGYSGLSWAAFAVS